MEIIPETSPNSKSLNGAIKYVWRMFAEVQTHQPGVYIFGLIYSAPLSQLVLDGLKTYTAPCTELWLTVPQKKRLFLIISRSTSRAGRIGVWD